MTTRWDFTDTGDCYDACQCNDEIKTGDTLLVRESGYRGPCIGRDEDGFRKFKHEAAPIDIVVVALAWAWPIAVTLETGNLHDIEESADAYAKVIADAGFTYAQIKDAVDLATKKGAPVRSLFLAWLHANAPVPAGWDSVEGGACLAEHAETLLDLPTLETLPNGAEVIMRRPLPTPPAGSCTVPAEIVLCRLPGHPEPLVTWQRNTAESVGTYWGHYFTRGADDAVVLADFNKRGSRA